MFVQQDWHSLRPALIGSIALARRPKRVGAVQPEDAETLGRSIIEQLDVQALSQKDRMVRTSECVDEIFVFVFSKLVKYRFSEIGYIWTYLRRLH